MSRRLLVVVAFATTTLLLPAAAMASSSPNSLTPNTTSALARSQLAAAKAMEAKVAASGLLSPGASAAWSRQYQAAAAQTHPSLPVSSNPCVSEMLDALKTTGSLATSLNACAPCSSAAKYLSALNQRVGNPAASSPGLPSASSPGEASSWNSMQGWLQRAVLNQNPALARGVTAASTGASTLYACLSGQKTPQTLSLPGPFANLNK